MERIKIQQHSFTGLSWFSGWLFTIGFLHLSFGNAILGVLVWPFFLGRFISTLVH